MKLTKKLKLICIFFFLIIVFIFIFQIFINSVISNPIVNNDKFIIVKKNLTENAFLKYLKNDNIKITKLEWKIAKFFTKEKFVLKQGEFLIKKNTSLINFLENINNNKVFYRKFTLIEGTNSRQLENKLTNSQGLMGTVLHIDEGKFKPDTYLYKWGDTKSSLLKKMEIEQNRFIDSHWKKRVKNNFVKTKFDAIILASIVEKEGKKSEELKNISSVFLNRLKNNMKLQSDATIAYALKKNGKDLNKLDLKSKNLFNTYRYKGLPPTPISYPSTNSILAVLYPNDTDYLYFVSDGKGGHRFSKTFSQHKKNIKLWIKVLKDHDEN